MKNPRVSFVSLGCAKNLVDSEVLLGHLAKGGFDLCADYKQSDVVVVNTCGFLASSEKESMDTIDSMVDLKGKGRLKAVVVAGCLPQRYGADFEKRLQGVDAVLGITNREKIAEVCSTILEKTRPARPLPSRPSYPSTRSTAPASASPPATRPTCASPRAATTRAPSA